MALTEEQAAIIDYLQKSEGDETVLINAIAGAGKTFLLTQIVDKIPHKRGIYLAYNKSVAVEAGEKFPDTINCSTVHSLAYRSVVRQYGLKVGNFSFRDVKERIPGDGKAILIEAIRTFCLSSFTDYEEFCESEGHSQTTLELGKKYMELMYQGKIECTHDFYLKVFHMGLASGSINFAKQDLLMVDEAGDINEVTLEIFKSMPARLKLAVGDECQNIYSFNNTINAFELLPDSTQFNMTQSFRVSEQIANRIETFCKKHINKDMSFKGVKLDNHSIETTAILARTNSALISCVIDLMEKKTPFTLVRKASEVFKVPLMLCFLKYEGTITDPEYKHLQADVDKWYENTELKKQYRSIYSYLNYLYSEDQALVTALRTLRDKGKSAVIEAYNYAKGMEGAGHSLYLSTSHSVKGLEYDSVYIHEDLNTAFSRALENSVDSPEVFEQEANLYYVACSRAKKELKNAKHL